MTDETIELSGEMLDRITGDNPPPLESWSVVHWMQLQRSFHSLRAAADRSAARDAKWRNLLQAERDYLAAIHERVTSKYGEARRLRTVDAARARRDALAKELGL